MWLASYVLYAYVAMYVFMYIAMFVHIHMHIYMHMYVCMYECTSCKNSFSVKKVWPSKVESYLKVNS